MKLKSVIISSMILIGTILTGCSNTKSNNSLQKKDHLNVYTTIYPLEDFTKKIGGKYVHVKSIYPAGIDAHDYEPSSKQVVDIAKSDLFIYNGAGMESFAEKLNETLKSENVTVLEATKNVPLKKFKGTEEETDSAGHQDEHHDKDPHVWLDPTLAKIEANNIKDNLVALQPTHKKYFENNFNELSKKFDDLDHQLVNMSKNAKRKDIVVSHAAYGYWEYHYGIHQLSIAGLSASNEPSQKQLKDIVDFVNKNHVKYILFETFATPKVAQVVEQETGAKILRLNHLATVSKEDLSSGKDYFSLMQENIDILNKALNDK
jgi:zinc transport system substrate-binding protein